MTAAFDDSAPRPSQAVFWSTAVPLFFLFGATVAPTVTGEDSGELIAAAHTLGVAHPPGYPLWILVTKFFQLLFGGVSVAEASNLGSAFTTAAACGLLATIALRLEVGACLAVTAGFLAGLAHEIWNHATITEVYPLALLLFAASILLFLRWREQPTLKRWFALTFVLGTGVAHHPLLLLFGPVFFIAALAAHPRLARSWRVVLVGVAGVVLPFLVYAQVWIAAASAPALSWGVEPSLRSVFAHWNREIYGSGPDKTPATLTKLAAQAAAFARFHCDNFTLPGVLLGLAGLCLAARRAFAGRLLAALYVTGTVGLLLLLKSDHEREELFASRVFLMPAYLALALGVGIALRRLSDHLPEGARSRVGLAALLIAPVVAGLTYAAHDRSSYRWSEDYGRAILDGCPRDALLFPGGDTSTFPLIYLQYVEGFRQDVRLLDRTGTIERAEALALLPEALRAEAASLPRDDLLDLLARKSGRPLLSLRPERAAADASAGATAYVPCGLGFRALAAGDAAGRKAAASRQTEFLAGLRIRNEAQPTVADYTSDLIRSHLAQARAAEHFAAGRPAAAIGAAEEARAAAAGVKETHNNVGSLLAEHGEEERAVACFAAAIAIRADYAVARRNLVIVLRRLGRAAEVLAACVRGLAFAPADAFFFQEGLAAAQDQGDLRAVARLCAHRLRVAPGDPAATKAMDELRDAGRPPLPGNELPLPDAVGGLFAGWERGSVGRSLERTLPAGPRFRREDDRARAFAPGREELAGLRAQLSGVGWDDPAAALPRAGINGEDP